MQKLLFSLQVISNLLRQQNIEKKKKETSSNYLLNYFKQKLKYKPVDFCLILECKFPNLEKKFKKNGQLPKHKWNNKVKRSLYNLQQRTGIYIEWRAGSNFVK